MPATLAESIAKAACQGVKGSEFGNCVYDVMVTGNPGFATTCVLSESIVGIDAASDRVNEKDPATWVWFVIGLLLLLLLVLLYCLWRCRRTRRRIA